MPLVASGDEHRKLVTVLFCDVVGSTALADSVDPEVLRRLLARYFERLRSIVEFHGGSVEKFIGDAVMAVFGVPVAHEDDALRACRAAVEMRQALPELGVQGRIGVNSGVVVAGTAERLATGDAVNVAARLQQAAGPGEVLIGSATLELAHGFVEADPVEPLTLKGKAEPVPAYRLLSVSEVEAWQRREEARFVGREQELALLRKAWERVLANRRCELVTIVGEAGIGKSRLVAETLTTLDARVIQGRCLPYGDGITYWPVVEVVRQLGTLPSDPAAAAAIRSLLGESDTAVSADEIAWAFRKLLEEESPLVVVFDDIHCGQETFLDLVERIPRLSSAAPLLVLCIARPELIARRDEWPIALRLEPLADRQVMELIGDRVSAKLGARVARAAGGNPLFVTEMLAMAEETADVEVPPTLQALLAARLDQLIEPERLVLECAAVEGEVFHRGAVETLAPGELQVTRCLEALLRRGLIRRDRGQIPGEAGYRFRHLLIRDAAHEALPKTARTDLHQRFAAWLDQHGRALVALDEIVGYHLEQAAHYTQELGSRDHALAERAGDRLAAAGRLALWRGDYQAAAPLLERALDLTRPTRLDVLLELDLATVVRVVGPLRGVAVAEAAAARARDAGDEPGEMLARLVAASHRAIAGADADLDELEALARAALPPFEQAVDHAALVYIWWALGFIGQCRGRFGEAAASMEKSLRHSELAGERRADVPLLVAFTVADGPQPAGEALRRLDELLAEHPSQPLSLLLRARLLAMLGRFDEAQAIAVGASGLARELGDPPEWALAQITALAGDHETAAQHLRRRCNELEQEGNRGFLSSMAPMLGRELCALGQYDEAERLAELGRELGAPDDVVTQMLWRQVQALVQTHRGEHGEAERLAREAVAISEQTDALNWQGDALCDLAQVLEAAGCTTEATETLEQTLDRYQRKENLAMVDQIRPRLQALRGGARRMLDPAR
jgi:class 3 adenylate cyclase/tetratricopeptide (TPR) repeat protein